MQSKESLIDTSQLFLEAKKSDNKTRNISGEAAPAVPGDIGSGWEPWDVGARGAFRDGLLIGQTPERGLESTKAWELTALASGTDSKGGCVSKQHLCKSCTSGSQPNPSGQDVASEVVLCFQTLYTHHLVTFIFLLRDWQFEVASKMNTA